MKKLVLLFLLISVSVFSQNEKAEKEESINRTEMPEKAQQYLAENLPQHARKVRYYFETDGDRKSYEAKFKFQKHRYSVEFSAPGQLEDIEIEVDHNELDEEIFQKISRHIDRENERFRIEKIQLQFLPDTTGKLPLEKVGFQAQPANYELIVATKNSGKLEKFEMTFDAQGNFVKKRKATRISYDYLIF
ncbi:hypothetical protein [Christiangramia flava]|uniref:Uncharacterized protein n=1 Tax=Christiangramia flava JLT2011 TaxID=1229726 RepID=A0A1L7I3W1_9FLAO|nr:hypothetical protein [Christiangramia flava]APU67863.1 hypothetical protein GRFL_1139 [Christiangramia flava JLT2011]OSS40365.1 hypothetical protein C723_0673 [Christiangramia flava JLT2011]